tara:strand:- start:608 stop:724 length:117 start_codon:yes stop_codon:yes gene_type:complete
MDWNKKVVVIEQIKKRLIKNSVVKDESWAYEVARRWAT